MFLIYWGDLNWFLLKELTRIKRKNFKTSKHGFGLRVFKKSDSGSGTGSGFENFPKNRVLGSGSKPGTGSFASLVRRRLSMNRKSFTCQKESFLLIGMISLSAGIFFLIWRIFSFDKKNSSCLLTIVFSLCRFLIISKRFSKRVNALTFAGTQNGE